MDLIKTLQWIAENDDFLKAQIANECVKKLKQLQLETEVLGEQLKPKEPECTL